VFGLPLLLRVVSHAVNVSSATIATHFISLLVVLVVLAALRHVAK